MSNLVACLCEGAAEHAILDILHTNNLLFDEILEDKILRVRSAKNFEEDYLRKYNPKKITVYRILDSRKENFKLSQYYKDKVTVINVITAPEIEVLYIISTNTYDKFKKSNMKPSDFCKSILKV